MMKDINRYQHNHLKLPMNKIEKGGRLIFSVDSSSSGSLPQASLIGPQDHSGERMRHASGEKYDAELCWDAGPVVVSALRSKGALLQHWAVLATVPDTEWFDCSRMAVK